MIVAMVSMGVVQVAIYQVIRVIPVRNGFMAATRTMLVIFGMAPAIMFRSAGGRIGGIDCQLMFFDPFASHVMQVAIVQIIDVAVVFNTCVAAALAVLVVVIGVSCRCLRHVQFSFLA
jgi:hypothetical protein